MFSVKMRAEKKGLHISGAERIVDTQALSIAASSLVERAIKKNPDSINIKIDIIKEPIIKIPIIKGCYGIDNNTTEARVRLYDILSSLGYDATKILEEFYAIRNMRGAILLDVHTYEHLEPDRQRGIRVSCFDSTTSDFSGVKDHIREAKLLASKVVSCENVVGEICVTDDVNYTFGYFASKEKGLIGIAHIKELNDNWGGRVILFDSSIGSGILQEKVKKCIKYLESTPVLID